MNPLFRILFFWAFVEVSGTQPPMVEAFPLGLHDHTDLEMASSVEAVDPLVLNAIEVAVILSGATVDDDESQVEKPFRFLIKECLEILAVSAFVGLVLNFTLNP